MTDANGAKVGTTEYVPYGEMREHTGTEVTNYKFTDQELDPETGLYNYGARLYDPVIGRFISPDTIIPNIYDPQMLNRYSYCRNNPLIYTDPTGHYIDHEGPGNHMGADSDGGGSSSGDTGGGRDGGPGRSGANDARAGDRWGKDAPSCSYDISEGRMTCTAENGVVVHSSQGWVSGLGGVCQNNPSQECIQQRNVGPIPPGDYTSTGIPAHRAGTDTTRRSLEPDPTNEMYGRGDLQTHYCPDPVDCSTGCIAQPDWDTITEFNEMLDTNPRTRVEVVP